MDLEVRIDELFQIDLGDFVAARNELAAELKAAGDRDGAKRVKAIAKPSVSAWAVNRVFWRARGQFERLVEAGEALRVAQASGAMTGAMRERRDALSVLLTEARDALAEAGRGASDGVMRRISTTFEALAAYGRHQPSPGAGRLSGDLEPPGFDVLAALAVAAAPPAGAETAPPNDDREAREQHLAALETAHTELADTARQLDVAGRRGRQAQGQRQTALARLAAAETELADASERLARATTRLAEARAGLATADADVATATADIAAAIAAATAALARLRHPTETQTS